MKDARKKGSVYACIDACAHAYLWCCVMRNFHTNGNKATAYDVQYEAQAFY